MLPHRILCPTDFSPAAQRAVRYAARLAEASRAHLDLVHVCAPDDAAQARERLEALADEIGAWGVAVSATVAGVRDAAAEVREVAREADLVVAAAHDGGGDLLKLGGLIATLARHAECPVLLVGPGGGRVSKGFRVVVPVDLSQASAAALREARGLAASLRGAVDVVLEVPDPADAARWGGEPRDATPEDRLRRVERFVEEVGGADVYVSVRLAEGPVREAGMRVVSPRHRDPAGPPPRDRTDSAGVASLGVPA